MFDLLKVSLLGAVMILVIIGIRALLQNRLHRTVFLILWLMTAVRLAVPVIPSSVFSVYNLLPQKQLQEVVEISGTYMNWSDGYAVVEINDPVATDPLPTEYVTSQGSEAVKIVEYYSINIPWILWLTGSVLCFLYFLWVHVRARLEYRFALPEDGPEFLGKVRLKRSDQVSAPLVYGFFRPMILLPENFPKKDSPEYEQVLWHELTHVRSGDLWYKLAMLLVTCIHWFNPLVWIMLRLSTQDMEIRCDARVIRKLGGKRAYALTLVQAEVRKPRHFAEAAFAFSLTELRLMAIAKAKVYLPRSIALLVILSLVLTCCFSTGPSAKAKEDPTVTEPTEAATELIEEIPTEESSEETTPLPTEPPPTVYMDEEREMAYLLSCDYEEYGSSLSLSMKEGQTEIMALKLPEYAVVSVDPNGKDKISATGEYAHDEGIYYLSLRGLKKGDATIYISLAQKQWMKIHVEIQFDPYYRVPDWQKYEAYGSARSFSMYSGSGNTATLTMKLPDRATYTYTLTRKGEAVQGYDLSVSKQYNYGNGSYSLHLTTMLLTGEAVIYFYIDGIYWCKVNVTVEMGYIPMETPSQGSSNSSQGNYSGGHPGNSTSGVYDYLKDLQSYAYPYPMREQYSGGPIQVFSTIYGKNGQIIPPGVYWPGQ